MDGDGIARSRQNRITESIPGHRVSVASDDLFLL